MATIGTAESLIAAVYDAVGVWIPDLPITPEKILLALKKKKAEAKKEG
jgi:CO/xanthine dehydrogenase Mo-binding subunit